MPNFIENYHSSLKGQQIWIELQQHDASNNRQKSIKIGINHFIELFIEDIEEHGIASIATLHLFILFMIY